MKLVLNAGCGPKELLLPEGFRTDEWFEIRMDLDASVNPTIQASVTRIPKGGCTFDAVFCSHTLEHLEWDHVSIALSEFRRVIKDDGFCVIVVPDLEAICHLLLSRGAECPILETDVGTVTPLDMIYGHRPSLRRSRPLMRHLCGFTRLTLFKAMEDARFGKVEVMQGQYNLYGVGYAQAIRRGAQAPSEAARLQAEHAAL